MTNLRSIVYVSTSAHELTTAELETLLGDAQAFNLQHGVTGVLLYSGNSFMQCFEGPPEDVQLVYARIKRSSKHKDIVEYMDCAVPKRTFSNWAMGLTQPAESQILALSTAEWSQLTRQTFSADSPAGLEMLKVFWSMHEGADSGA